MPKGKPNSVLDAGVNDLKSHWDWSGDSDPTEDQASRPSSAPPRMSVLAAMKIPYLRRLEAGDNARIHKTPLLTLNLSSHSFLDSTLKDDLSPCPLYTIRTVSMTTTVVRTDPWDSTTKTAIIKWPRIVPTSKGKNVPDGVLVQVGGSRWKGGDSFLKPNTSKNGPRKFNLPHYSHSLKWQKHGTGYWCTTSTVKGPIAIFEPAVETIPGRLIVFETLHDKYETGPMLVHHGVSIFLLDYLVVTAILLVTDIQEWMLVQSPNQNNPSDDPSSNAGLRWRKIAHGEPLFPKISQVTTRSDNPCDFDLNPAPSAPEKVENSVHSEPLYPFQHASTSRLSFSSDSEDEEGDHHPFSGITRTSPFSPSAESCLLNKSAPSHTYLDPSFYLNQGIPPIPHSPCHFSDQARPASPASTGSRQLRELPVPPPHAMPTELIHPRLIPLRVLSEASSEQNMRSALTSDSIGPADPDLWRRRPSEPIMRRQRSLSRPLPQAPSPPNADIRDPAIRRVRSHARIGQTDAEKQPPPVPVMPLTPRTPRAGRTLPPTPLDLAMGRTMGGMVRADESHLVPKSYGSEEDTSRWLQILSSQQGPSSNTISSPLFDQPPPAYSTIDFHSTG